MALIQINKNPSRRDLAWFGLVLGLFFALVGGLIYWRTGAAQVAAILWVAAAAIVAVYYAVPPARRWIYLGWMYAAFPIGWTISHLILALTYYLVITPIGLAMRLCGYDPMERKLDRQAATYWKPHRQDDDVKRYFRQF